MEALMLFSSDDECNEINNNAGHDVPSTETHKFVFQTEAMHHDSAQQVQDCDQLRVAVRSDTERQLNLTVSQHSHSFVANLSTASIAKPMRRKRVKKCTYAARREEVARLRLSSVYLEAQLVHLQKRRHSIEICRHRVQHERERLVQARAENARLHALLYEVESRRERLSRRRALCVG